MIATIDRQELVYLSFSINDTKTKLRWEHSKEFEYQHQMYDIVESELKGDSVFYWCWWDHAETSLNKKLNDLVAGIMQKDPQHQQKQSRMMDFFRSLFLPVTKQLYDVCTEPEQHDFFQSAHQLFSHHFPPLTPPPKII